MVCPALARIADRDCRRRELAEPFGWMLPGESRVWGVATDTRSLVAVSDPAAHRLPPDLFPPRQSKLAAVAGVIDRLLTAEPVRWVAASLPDLWDFLGQCDREACEECGPLRADGVWAADDRCENCGGRVWFVGSDAEFDVADLAGVPVEAGRLAFTLSAELQAVGGDGFEFGACEYPVPVAAKGRPSVNRVVAFRGPGWRAVVNGLDANNEQVRDAVWRTYVPGCAVWGRIDRSTDRVARGAAADWYEERGADLYALWLRGTM
jgi:hypothetical protein